jgi:hypothetical protein
LRDPVAKRRRKTIRLLNAYERHDRQHDGDQKNGAADEDYESDHLDGR